MFRTLIGALVWMALLVGPVRLDAAPTMVERVPEPNPPVIELDIPEAPSARALEPYPAPSPTPSTEWSYHKTSDNLHPDGNEQQMLWLLNRARSNPTQEGIWLATISDPDIAAARTFWGVDLSVLQAAFAAIPVRPPAAFDVRLYTAAKAHSDYLISIDDQTHTGQFDRIDAAGFKYTAAAGIVFSYSEHTVYGHAGFNIDWGSGPYGMQDPPGHRNAIMSTNTYYSNVGYAVVPENNISTQVGPQVITGNLAYANTGYPDHFNRFIVGTVWEDTNCERPVRPGRGPGGGDGHARQRHVLRRDGQQRRLRGPGRRGHLHGELFRRRAGGGLHAHGGGRNEQRAPGPRVLRGFGDPAGHRGGEPAQQRGLGRRGRWRRVLPAGGRSGGPSGWPADGFACGGGSHRSVSRRRDEGPLTQSTSGRRTRFTSGSHPNTKHYTPNTTPYPQPLTRSAGAVLCRNSVSRSMCRFSSAMIASSWARVPCSSTKGAIIS